MYAHACSRHKPTRSRESSGVHVFHGVPEAPCVGPKYYTQTVAITSKPEIPHSTFLIPPARLLSWAPHEEPLLEREGSCISLSVCLSVCLSVSGSHSALLLSLARSLSAQISLAVIPSVCDSPAPSIFLFLPLPVYLYLLFPLSSAVLCRPLSHSLSLSRPAFVYFAAVPRSASCLLLMRFVRASAPSLQDSLYFASFPFVSCSASCCLSLCLPLPLCLQIFM